MPAPPQTHGRSAIAAAVASSAARDEGAARAARLGTARKRLDGVTAVGHDFDGACLEHLLERRVIDGIGGDLPGLAGAEAERTPAGKWDAERLVCLVDDGFHAPLRSQSAHESTRG